MMLIVLVGCGPTTKNLRILDRPLPMNEVLNSCKYVPVPGNIFCVSEPCAVKETQYMIKLNQTIDNYELMLQEFNK